MSLKTVIFILMITVLPGCSRKSIHTLQRKGVNVTQSRTTVSTSKTGSHQLQLQYLGCGGLLIKYSDQALMIDPFFSNQRFMKVGRSMLLGAKIKSDKKAIAFGRQRILDSLEISADELSRDVKAILVAHGHYDHLMDVPYLHKYWFNSQPEVFANTSAINTCSNVIAADKLHNSESMMSVREQTGSSVEFKAADGTLLRIHMQMAAHNPHSNHMKLFSGGVMKPVSYFKRPEDKTSANDWLEGRTLSFLIDIVKEEKIVFRVFVQSSSCQFPDGMPPTSLLEEKKVDVAVLGVASYKFSEDSYPCEYLRKLGPSHIIFTHWEDFFRKYQRKPKSLMKTDMERFFKHLLPSCSSTPYTLPIPGVVVNMQF